MHCPELDELERLIADDASDPSSENARLHVAGCDSCRSMLGELRANLELVTPLRRVLGGSLTAPPAPPLSVPIPQWIGRYRVLRELGRGGMGVVYECEQARPQRSVAIKVLSSARSADPRQARLLEREARALARLSHPGIATVFESGTTGDGSGYFVMELVRGAPLLKFASQEQLGLRERVLLFRQICDAIAYAHQHGVIHRDLKPANILITRTGASAPPAERGAAPCPKVLDFGLARLILEEDADASAMTDTQRLQGTLPYMSPEQVRGSPDALDVRSDIYSLGVVLYELLTGALPYPIERGALLAAARAICETPPQRPGLLKRELRGDLETILLKTLAKEPARRYPSASELSADLQRWLDRRPILARPPTLAYQFSKLVERQPLGAGLGALLLTVLLALGPTMFVLYARTEHLREVAETERRAALASAAAATSESAKSAAVNRFLQELLASADPEQTGSTEVTVRRVLDDALVEIDGGALADQPLVEAAVRTTLGRSYQSLSLIGPAADCLERALALREQAHEQTPHADLADSRLRLSGLRLVQGRYAEARQLAQAALAETQACGGGQRATALAVGARADAESAMGEFAQARASYEEALRVIAPIATEAPLEGADLLAGLAQVAQREDRPDEAMRLRREALTRVERALGPRHPAFARALQAVGDAHEALGEIPQAIDAYERALALFQEIFGANHLSVARCRHHLAVARYQAYEHARAADEFAGSRTVFVALLGPRHPDVASSDQCRAQALQLLGRFEEAESAFRDALATYVELLGDEHPFTAAAMSNLAECLGMRGKWDEAAALHARAVEATKRIYGSRHSEVAVALDNVANTCHARGDAEGAERAYREAWAIYRETLDPLHPMLRHVQFNLAFLFFNQGRHADAEPLLRAIVEADERRPTGVPFETAHGVKNLGTCLALQGRGAEAEPLFERAIELFRALPGSDQIVATTLRELGEARLHCGDALGALPALREGLAAISALLPEGHAYVAMNRMALAEALLALGEPEEAAGLLKPAFEALRAGRGLEHRQTQRCLQLLISLFRSTGQEDSVAELQTLIREVPQSRRPAHADGADLPRAP